MENIAKIIEDMCDNYCKYPESWNSETDGELSESDICKNCPLNKLGDGYERSDKSV